MNNRLLRTFVAIPIPEKIGKLRNRLLETVPKNSGKINWIQPSNIHVTLHFLGPTPPDIIGPIKSALNEIAKDHRAFDLSLEGTGCFPKPRRPRVLWLGIGKEIEALIKLVQSIGKAMTDLGFPSDERNFIPHITLARIKYPQKKTPDINKFLSAEFAPIEWRANYFHFLQSELFSNGAVYTILGTHFLQN